MKVVCSFTTVPHYSDCSEMTQSFLESELLFVLHLKRRMKFLCASFHLTEFPRNFQQFGQVEGLRNFERNYLTHPSVD